MKSNHSISISGKNINYFKAQASILLKQLKETDLVVNSELRYRLNQCGQQDILLQQEPIKRKQALKIVALESGFDSWSELKRQVEFETAIDFQTFFCSSALGGFLNHWFNNYLEAKALQEKMGGILLPFRHQFFVAPMAYLDKLGFTQGDADWQAIGYDWISPESQSAKMRIIKKLITSWR